jgi:hypothetical protein
MNDDYDEVYGCNPEYEKAGYPSPQRANNIDGKTLLEWVKKNCPDYTVLITGGEPTMHPDFKMIVLGLVSNGREVYIQSNGYKKDKNDNYGAYWAIHWAENSEFPASFGFSDKEVICIVEDDNDRAVKVNYCHEHKIPYYISGARHSELSAERKKKFDIVRSINPFGQYGICMSGSNWQIEGHIWAGDYKNDKDKQMCETCYVGNFINIVDSLTSGRVA